MATVVLTDEQVVELVMQLSPESKRVVLQALKAEDEEVNEPQNVDKDGVLVVRAPLLRDISNIVDEEREARLATFLGEMRK